MCNKYMNSYVCTYMVILTIINYYNDDDDDLRRGVLQLMADDEVTKWFRNFRPRRCIHLQCGP